MDIAASSRSSRAFASSTASAAEAAYSEGSARRKTSTSLSVIVPVYNEQYLVETSLGRLQVLSESPLLESIKIIVVDDASTDGTPEAIRRFRASLESSETDPKISWEWMRHKKNSGKGAGIRTALFQVDTELVVIHDAD